MLPNESKFSSSLSLLPQTSLTVIKHEDNDTVDIKLEFKEEPNQEDVLQPRAKLSNEPDEQCTNEKEIEPELVELKYEVKEENWVDESEEDHNINPIETTTTTTTTSAIYTSTTRLNRLQRYPRDLSLSDFDSPSSSQQNKQSSKKKKTNITIDDKISIRDRAKSAAIGTVEFSQRANLQLQHRSCPKCGKVLKRQKLWTLHVKACRKNFHPKQQKQGQATHQTNSNQEQMGICPKQKQITTTILSSSLPLSTRPNAKLSASSSTSNSTPSSSSAGRITRIGNFQAVFINGQTRFIPVKEEKDCTLDSDGNRDQQVLDQEFSCHLCDFKTNQSHLLTLHRPVHAKKIQRKCPEPTCDFTYVTTRSLKLHEFRQHEKMYNLQTFNCSYPPCSYQTPKKHHLQQHINAVHVGLKKFACHLCPYKATLMSILKQHMNGFHSNLRRFKCPESGSGCEYAAKTKQSLKIHLKSKHKKSKSEVTAAPKNLPPASKNEKEEEQQ